MKIVLTAINAKYIHSNLAIYSLKAYAKKYQEEIELAEYTINQQTDDILMDLYKRKPDLLCFSCYIWNLDYVEELIHEIKKIRPELPIWVGGPEVSYDAKEVLERLPEVTGVMCGEGEQTFAEVLDYYHESSIALKDIRGIAYRDSNDGIVENEWRQPMDLSQVPFVYEKMDDFKNKIIYYESSRGCPFSCSYCLSSIDKCLRFRDLCLVKEELLFLIRAKVPQVKFVDRTFNCNHKHALEIWKFIQEQDLGFTNFHFEVSADLLNEEEIQLIEQMRPGLIQLEIGVQSTNEKTIREIRRTMKFAEVERIVNRIHQNQNVHQHLDLIAGLPYEDLTSFQTSFNDVYALRPEQLQLGFLKVLKGSYMEQQKEAYGLLYKQKPPYEVLQTKWLSYEDVLELKRVEEMVELYYNSGQFTYTLKHLEKEFLSAYQLYQKLGVFYESKGFHLLSHTRVAKYEILLDFIKSICGEKETFYRELLTFDFYLRENAKNRPQFAGEYTISKEELRDFYETEAQQPQFLEGYDGYDQRQLRKMTHMEAFHYDVMGEGMQQKQVILFDYQNRSSLTHQACIYQLTCKNG